MAIRAILTFRQDAWGWREEFYYPGTDVTFSSLFIARMKSLVTARRALLGRNVNCNSCKAIVVPVDPNGILLDWKDRGKLPSRDFYGTVMNLGPGTTQLDSTHPWLGVHATLYDINRIGRRVYIVRGMPDTWLGWGPASRQGRTIGIPNPPRDELALLRQAMGLVVFGGATTAPPIFALKLRCGLLGGPVVRTAVQDIVYYGNQGQVALAVSNFFLLGKGRSIHIHGKQGCQLAGLAGDTIIDVVEPTSGVPEPPPDTHWIVPKKRLCCTEPALTDTNGWDVYPIQYTLRGLRYWNTGNIAKRDTGAPPFITKGKSSKSSCCG